MKTVKKLLLILLIAACVFSLFGCNDDDNDDTVVETAIYSRDAFTMSALEKAMGYDIVVPRDKACTSYYVCYYHPTLPSTITYDAFDDKADYYYTKLRSAPYKTVGIYAHKTDNVYEYQENDETNIFRTVYYIHDEYKKECTVEGLTDAYLYWTSTKETYYFSFTLGDMNYVIFMAGTNEWEENEKFFIDTATNMLPVVDE